MRQQPKKNLTLPKEYKASFGNIKRKEYQNTILEKAPIFPKPLEYDDIDNAMFDFVDNELDMVIDGKLIPTYTLYSNQRFSEYSQMWQHTDENGNLYLNFKTVNREKNPSNGGNQGGLWNIPGERRYTLLQQRVLDNNGTESYEIYTMKQPYAVDLNYTINFVTTNLEYLNDFNQKINKKFSSRQCYIRPNGHYIPMIIEDISDETTYSISDRKFFVQSVIIKLMAYIIHEEDFEVKKYPRRINAMLEGDKFKKNKACVEIEEIENPLKNRTISVIMKIPQCKSKVDFEFDTEMVVERIVTDNVRNARVMINGNLCYTDKTFNIHDGDEVRVKITPIECDKECKVEFIGYSPNEYYDSSTIAEKVFEEEVVQEDIFVD